MSGLLSEPNGEIGLLGGKISELNLKRLLVLLAHIGDARLICVHPIA